MKRTIHKSLALTLTLCMLLMLLPVTAWAVDDNEAPTVVSVTVSFTDGTTATGTSGVTCLQNKTVSSIKALMNEAVTVTEGAVVTMRGTSGDCQTHIPGSVTYGTIALDSGDATNKTLKITPNAGNGTAGYTGEMTFSVAADAVKDLSDNGNAATTFTLTVLAVAPCGAGVAPAAGTTVNGTQIFTFPFETGSGALTELELDIYLGALAGEGNRIYNQHVGINLPTSQAEINTLIDGINDQFKTTSRENLVSGFGGGTKGENYVRFFEAAGFRAGQDKAAEVKQNVTYTGSTTKGTWSLTLNTYLLETDKLEFLVAATNDQGGKWGENNYSLDGGARTKAFLYTLTQDTFGPTVADITVTFTDDTTASGTTGISCQQGKTVKNIKVTMSEPVTVAGSTTVSMKGLDGDCKIYIPNSLPYGVLSLDAADETGKTLLITPNAGNGTAAHAGIMTFTAAAGAVKDAFGNDSAETAFNLTVSKVEPVAPGVTPATGTAIDGAQAFTFPFTSTYGALDELALDIYLGDNTGGGRDAGEAVPLIFPASQNEINTQINTINSLFKNKTREQLVSYFEANGDADGGTVVRVYEAMGFRVGEDKAAEVKQNITYTAAGAATGTWKLTLNTYLLQEAKLELLVSAKNDKGFQWGDNDFEEHGSLTKVYLYTLKEDEAVPEAESVTVKFTDGTTATSPDGFMCEQGQTVKSITVVMSEPVTVTEGAQVTMEGISGDCKGKIPAGTVYGTIALDAKDTTGKTLIITPKSGNATAGTLGIVEFTVAEGAVKDAANLGNEEYTYILIVGKSFADVADTSWYYTAVTFLSALGVTNGVGNDKYAPENQITRAEFLVLIMRAYGIAPDKEGSPNFSDAGTDKYYTGYLAAAKRLGITNGVGDNKFAPDLKISRQEMFTMLYRMLDKPPTAKSDLSGYSDRNQIASYALEAFQVLVKAGIVQGSDGKLDPAGVATRAQAAQILYNLLTKLG